MLYTNFVCFGNFGKYFYIFQSFYVDLNLFFPVFLVIQIWIQLRLIIHCSIILII